MPFNAKATARWTFGALALLALAGCNRGGTGAGGNEIVIGEYGSLSGAEADFGTTTDNGVQLAAEQLNAKGGILGKKVRVIRQDDQGNADQVATIVTRFVNSDRVDVVIGEVASSLSLRAAPICQTAKVPMITPSSTNPKVTEVGDYIFRVCFTDPQQGAAIAHFASGNLKARRMAVLRDAASAYSMGLADYTIDAFKKDGGTIVSDKSYQKGDDNFRAQLTDIASRNPDVLLVPGYYSDVSLIAKQAREAGIKAPLIGGDGWDSPNLIKNAGTALEGSYFSNHFSEVQGGPVIQKFVEDYMAKFGEKPNALAALGYDAMNIYAAAVEKVKTTDKAKVREALASTVSFQGVTGDITMDPNRNVTKPVVILQIKGDKFEYLTTVKP